MKKKLFCFVWKRKSGHCGDRTHDIRVISTALWPTELNDLWISLLSLSFKGLQFPFPNSSSIQFANHYRNSPLSLLEFHPVHCELFVSLANPSSQSSFSRNSHSPSPPPSPVLSHSLLLAGTLNNNCVFSFSFCFSLRLPTIILRPLDKIWNSPSFIRFGRGSNSSPLSSYWSVPTGLAIENFLCNFCPPLLPKKAGTAPTRTAPLIFCAFWLT